MSICVQFIRGLQQQTIQFGDAGGVRSGFTGTDLLVTHTAFPCDQHMLTPLVAGLAQIADTQYDQLPVAQTQRGFTQNVIGEHHPTPRQIRVVAHGFEDIEDAPLIHKRLHQLLRRLIPLIGFQWRNSWFV